MLAKLKTLREEREDGFTLVELLVVILIIGILSAIAIPVFLNQRKTANDSAVQSDVKNAVAQVETWLVSNNNTDNFPAVTAFDLKVSPGVTIRIVETTTGVAANGYKVCGHHSNGKNYSALGTSLVYNSQEGGMQKGATTCTGATGAAVLQVIMPG